MFDKIWTKIIQTGGKGICNKKNSGRASKAIKIKTKRHVHVGPYYITTIIFIFLKTKNDSYTTITFVDKKGRETGV